jgi:hypothetical protein
MGMKTRQVFVPSTVTTAIKPATKIVPTPIKTKLGLVNSWPQVYGERDKALSPLFSAG